MITITFNPQNAEQVQILAHAMVSMLNTSDSPQAEAPAPEPAKEAPAKKPKAAKPAPVAETPAEPEAKAATESAPTFTLEQVRAKLYSLKEDGKDVGSLIAATGHPNLTAIPADEYPALMANAEKL